MGLPERLTASSRYGPDPSRLPPGAVAALVAEQPSVAHLDGLVGDAVEEVAVVGDEDYRPGEHLELPLEDLERAYVQVVGRLVEDEAVGLGEHEQEELQACALPAGQVSHGLAHLLVAGEKEGQHVHD